jgi:phosphatidylglycerophosphate synthase
MRMTPESLLHVDDAFASSLPVRAVTHWACEVGVHPNVVTAFALVLTLAIVYFHHVHSETLVVACILLRQIFDILDGNIARACNKMSTFGKHFDLVTDLVFWAVMVYVFSTFFVSSARVRALIMVFWTTVLVALYVHCSHAEFKEYRGSPLQMALAFIANSSLVIMFAICLAYVLIFYYADTSQTRTRTRTMSTKQRARR